MNERIRELYNEALEYADSKVPPQHRYNDIYYAIAAGKHAELIVRECAGIVSSGPFYAGMASKVIKEHFGVESCKY